MHTRSTSSPLTSTALVVGIVERSLSAGGMTGSICGAIFGTLVVPFFGTVVGFTIGGLVGLSVGLGNAIGISLLSIFVFYPLYDRDAYARSIRCISIFLTLLLSLVGFSIARSTDIDIIIVQILELNTFVHLPAFIAAIMAWPASQRIIRWYVSSAPATPYLQQQHKRQAYTFIILCIILIPLTAGLFFQQWLRFHFRALPGQEIIVYVNDNTHDGYLMYASPDGAIQERLTYHFETSALNNPPLAFQPHLAAQGEGIIYLSDHAAGNDHLFYHLRLNGTAARHIRTWTQWNRDAVLSPDRQKLVHSSRIYVHPLPNNGGLTIETVERTDVKVRTVNGSTEWCLTCSLAQGYGTGFAWSADGQSVLFAYRSALRSHLFVADWNGNTIVQLTKNSEADDFAPTWSPDGQWIAFTRIQDQQANIMVMRSDGTEVRQLTTTGAESAPAWSPDGTHIVFMSRHLNTEEEANTRNPKYFSNIHVMRSDGSERRPITSGPNNYEDPIWVRAPSQ